LSQPTIPAPKLSANTSAIKRLIVICLHY
jgi:hypothetical protein